MIKNVANKNYNTDIKWTFQYTRWLLNLLGIWPMIMKSSSKRVNFYSKLVIAVCLLMIIFTMLPSTLHTILREKNPLVRLMLVGPVSASLASFIKYILIILRGDAIKNCLENIENDWMTIDNEEDRAIMTRNSIVGRRITLVCSLFLYTGGFSYHTILPLLRGTKFNDFNMTIRPLVYPGYDIFVEPQTSPIYEIIFFLTCISALVRYTVTITICNLSALFVSHACGQYEIVILRLKRIFDGIIDVKRDNEIIEKKISFVVKFHARGLRLSSKIDEALSEIFLIEVVAATLIICLLEYYCMTEWNNSETVAIITYFILLISYVFNIFVLCHIGELFKEQFQKIGKAAYMIEWYRLPGKNGLAIVMVMAMSNYPRKITAGRMMELSVCSFGLIIKTSIMYLNMLRTIAD